MSTNSLHAVIIAWLNASQISPIGDDDNDGDVDDDDDDCDEHMMVLVMMTMMGMEKMITIVATT